MRRQRTAAYEAKSPWRALFRRLQEDERGQAATEFAIILPMFLGIVFAVLTFAMMMISNEMTYYATFMAARATAVGSNRYESAASGILPGILVTDSGGGSDVVTMEGRYRMHDFLTGGSGALRNSFADALDLETTVTMHRWPLCTNGGDNMLAGCP